MLPPYPQLVTTDPSIKVNQPGNRSVMLYEQMLRQLSLMDPRYARDENGTKCNYYVHDCMHVMGYPMLYMLARQYIEQWIEHGPMVPMVMQDAVINANLGCPTVAALREPRDKHSHVMMVLPQKMPTEPARLMVSQAGAMNFYGRYASTGVPVSMCKDLLYFGAP